MSQSEVTIVDYGMGNLLSVARGFEHFGFNAEITSDVNTVLNAKRIVLPGVGAFGSAMSRLESLGLDRAIKEKVRKDVPFLGICLGMQLMLDSSLEFGENQGLGLIGGKVVPIPGEDSDRKSIKIPHIGWAQLLESQNKLAWDGTPLANIESGSYVYFVHSFMAVPEYNSFCLAICEYGGHEIPALIGQGKCFGCQFHPEKSGEIGLQLLNTFMSI